MTDTWVQLSPGEYERQFEHAYYRVHHNLVTGQWHLGRRLDPKAQIMIVGVYGTYRECRMAAERREASL
jgi:hypothetical protein